MKLFKSIIGVALLAAIFAVTALPAMAQNGADYFGIPRTVVVSVPQVLTATSSNNPVDLRHFIGIAKLDLVCVTNADIAGNVGAVTCTVQHSDDLTNWTSAPYALATSKAIIYTNTAAYGSSMKATNTYLLPGTYTTATAATAGFAGSYLVPAPFTNTADLTITSVKSIGLDTESCKRYLQVLWTLPATQTNTIAGAILTGRANYVP